MDQLKKSRMKLIAAMVIFGTLGPFVRHIPVSSGVLALCRALMAAAVLGAYLLITKQPLGLKAIGRDLPLLLISGVAMGINWVLLFEAYRYTTVSVATLSYYFAPVIVTVACPVLFREKMGAKQWLCFGMSTLGIVLITGVGDLSQGNSHLTGILFGLGAAVLYASVVLINKFIRGVSGIRRTVLQFGAALTALVPYVACNGGISFRGMDTAGWLCLLTVGLVHTGAAYCLYFSGLKDLSGQVVHPNAMRYLLYKVKTELEDRRGSAAAQVREALTALELYSPEADDVSTFNAGFSRRVLERNLDELCAAEKGEGEDPSWLEKLTGYERIYDTLNSCFVSYCQGIREYGEKLAELEAYKQGAEYVGELCRMFERFYRGFSEKVVTLARKQDDLVDALRFRKGDSVYNVCASREVLEELSRSTRDAEAQGTMLGSDLNARIFDAVKANVAFDIETRNADAVEEDRRIDIFDDILLGYFQDTVRRHCDSIDVNIIEAMAMENRMLARIRVRRLQEHDEPVFDTVTHEDNLRHIQSLIAMGQRLAAPGIQRLRSEEARELMLCAYNKSLDNMRNYRMSTLIGRPISASGVDTVSRYELHFYNALYNLTPDKLDKFACPAHSETGSRNAGLYHNAYVKYSRNIGPDSTKCSTISTHIDKRWDSVAVMPELDMDFQCRQIMKIHQALIYGLIHKAITYRSLSHAAAGKRVYKYEDSDERYMDLTVSNGTLCDEFYEILDALYVSSSIVEDIGVIRNKKRARDLTRNSNYDATVFARDLEEFQLDFLHSGPTSLFEIPLAYYNTLPNSKRYASELSALVEAVIRTFRDELTTWESENDVKFLLCDILTQQYFLLMENYGKYAKLNCGTRPCDHPVLDIIFRKVRKVVETTPEPEDYEDTVSRMRACLR